MKIRVEIVKYENNTSEDATIRFRSGERAKGASTSLRRMNRFFCG